MLGFIHPCPACCELNSFMIVLNRVVFLSFMDDDLVCRCCDGVL